MNMAALAPKDNESDVPDLGTHSTDAEHKMALFQSKDNVEL